MTRRITFPWPDTAAFRDRGGEPIRVLAVSDEPDPTLDHARNREQLGHVDLVVGCGDLDRDHLGFLADAFHAPVLYVRGNHDRGVNWQMAKPLTPGAGPGRADRLRPWACCSSGCRGRARPPAGRRVMGSRRGARHSARQRGRATRQAPAAAPEPRAATRRRRRSDRPVPPGFAAYRWLLRRLRPPLWLHGHTTVATVASTRVEFEGTSLINVTGAVLVTLEPTPDDSAE